MELTMPDMFEEMVLRLCTTESCDIVFTIWVLSTGDEGSCWESWVVRSFKKSS